MGAAGFGICPRTYETDFMRPFAAGEGGNKKTMMTQELAEAILDSVTEAEALLGELGIKFG